MTKKTHPRLPAHRGSKRDARGERKLTSAHLQLGLPGWGRSTPCGAPRRRAVRRNAQELFNELALAGPSAKGQQPSTMAFCGSFRFLYFLFPFFKKYIFDLKIYRNIPRPPRCRAAGTWSPRCGVAGLLCKNFCESICA